MSLEEEEIKIQEIFYKGRETKECLMKRVIRFNLIFRKASWQCNILTSISF